MSNSDVKDKTIENSAKIMDNTNTKLESISKETVVITKAVKGRTGKVKVKSKSADKANTEKRPSKKTYQTKGPIDNIKPEIEHVNNINATKGTFSNTNAKKGLSDSTIGKKGPVKNTGDKKGPADNGTGNKNPADNVAVKVRPAKIIKQNNRPVINANSKKELNDNAMAKGRPDDLMNLARAKLQSALNPNSKKEPVSNINLKMGPISYADLRKVHSSNANVEKEFVDNVNKNKTVYDVNTKQEGIDDLNVEKDLDSKEKEELAVRSFFFVKNLEQYLTRCYDIERQGFSAIAEHHTNLFPSCKVLLRGCLDNYESSQLFPSYISNAKYYNTRTILKSRVKRVLISVGKKENHSKFLRISALFLLLGCDLNRMTSFSDAPYCIMEAITEAIMATKQRNYIFLWFPKQC